MHVSVLSDVVKGAIVATDIVEGLAVTLTNSGVVNGFQTDLPFATVADSGATNIYVVAAAPDNFPRPVDLRQYRAGWYAVMGRADGDFSEPVETVTRYNVGISNLYNPTIPSGFLVNVHRGGRYTVPSACYVDSDGIKVPGNFVEVGAGGKWQYTADRTNAVGEVVEYRADTAELCFELYQ